MSNFLDTNHFGAGCVGVVALATFYQGDVHDWALIVLPAALAIGYYLMFQKKAN
jgi:hypothetical protein